MLINLYNNYLKLIQILSKSGKKWRALIDKFDVSVGIIFIMIFILSTNTIAECGTWDSTNTPTADLEALVETLDPRQIDDLNNILNNEPVENTGKSTLLRNLLIFATINIALILFMRYHTTILEQASQFFYDSADTVAEAARQAARHRIHSLLENPENLPRVRNAIYTVIEMKQVNMMPK